MRHMLIVVAMMLALQGCAATGTSRTALGAQALRQGNFTTAEVVLSEAVQRGERPDVNWYNLGLLYYAQARQSPITRDAMLQQAQSAFTLAARYGNPAAQDVLHKWGKPVPVADLAARADQSDGLASLLLLGAAAIATKGATPSLATTHLPVDCTSMATGNVMHTNCW